MSTRPVSYLRAPMAALCLLAAMLAGSALTGSASPTQVTPRIITPVAFGEYIFGDPIIFRAVDDAHECHDSPHDMIWRFREVGELNWHIYQFTSDRILGANGQDRVLPLPGDYEATVTMCGVITAPRQFSVRYDEPLHGEEHPNFATPGDGQYWCYIDWTDPENDNHKTTAHFNAYWNTTVYGNLDIDQDDCLDPVIPAVTITQTVPSDQKLGLLECTYATLDYYMTGPLEDRSLYHLDADYAHLSHLTFFAGGPNGGGRGIPQGLGYGQLAINSDWVPVHELFHVFDYAGNPLHLRLFDQRNNNNAYVFLHEAVTNVEETLSGDPYESWGYRTDQWPIWTPIDLGQFELDYDAGVFWSYVINTYGYSPRPTWDGPPIDACNQLKDSQPPHNFKFFEEWNRRVREQIANELGLNLAQGPELIPYGEEFCSDRHLFRDTGGDKFFLYNGEIEPSCLQTMEYEMWVLESMAREGRQSAGTPLGESLMLDFAVAFAKAFPPKSLLDGMPASILCDALQGITFSYGFGGGDEYRLCDPAIEDDFYGRIRFKIKDPTAKYLVFEANDDATLYVDGRAVIGEQDPTDSYLDENLPDASSTYADQTRENWPVNPGPWSSIFPVGDPTGKTFEFEWVNRGDGKGNNDCHPKQPCLSRYLLLLEKYDPLTGERTPFSLLSDLIEIERAEFWPEQGSGKPGFDYDVLPLPNWWNYDHPIDKEIQLRPVSLGERPFLLPALGVNYHPVACPERFDGELLVQIRDDELTHTRPSASLMTVDADGTVEWLGRIAHPADYLQNVVLQCDGNGGPAERDGKPAFLLLTTERTLHHDTPYGTMGAAHYTVIVRAPRLFLPELVNPLPSGFPTRTPFPTLTPTPTLTPIPTPTGLPPLPSPTPDPIEFYLPAVADSYVSLEAPASNFGGAPVLYVGKNSTSIGRALLRFDLSGLPPEAAILSVELEAYLSSASPEPANLNIEVRQVNYPWSESSVNWNTQPASSSIDKSNPVAIGAGYYSWDITAMAQDWLNGAQPNYGLALWSAPETILGWRGFDSKENTQANPPRLKIRYLP